MTICRCEEETVDHLLIHCKYAHTLWSEVLRLFGVQWVMPKNVVSLLSAWWNWLGSHTSNVWNMIPVYLMWLIWTERNARTFEEIKRLVNCVKSLLLRTLFEWSRIWGLRIVILCLNSLILLVFLFDWFVFFSVQ